MMRVFLDANIIISILNCELPLFNTTNRLLSLQGKRVDFYTSTVCLAIAYYFAEKKYGSKFANLKMAHFCNRINISDCSAREVYLTTGNKKINDFEDGLEYYSAKSSQCNVIITEDTNDFHFSEIEIATSEQFLKKYFIKS